MDENGQTFEDIISFYVVQDLKEPPSATLTSPNTGKGFIVGTSYTIKYKSVNVRNCALHVLFPNGSSDVLYNGEKLNITNKGKHTLTFQGTDVNGNRYYSEPIEVQAVTKDGKNHSHFDYNDQVIDYSPQTKTVSVALPKNTRADLSVQIIQNDPNGKPLAEDQKWLSHRVAEDKVTLYAKENPASVTRSAQVNFTCHCGDERSFTVYQKPGAAAPTLKLKVGENYYDENNVYGDLKAGGTLYLRAEFTNAKRLYIHGYHPETKASVFNSVFNSTVTGNTTDFWPTITNVPVGGVYQVKATVSNSDIANNPWAQKKTVTMNLKLKRSEILTGKRKIVYDRAYEWINYAWDSDFEIALHNRNYTYPAKELVYGIPYSLSTGNVFETPDSFEKKVLNGKNSDGKPLVSTTVSYLSENTKDGPVYGKTPKYGADCSRFVYDCWKAAGFKKGSKKIIEYNPQIVKPIELDQIRPGDVLNRPSGNGNEYAHIMLVVDVDYENEEYTVIHQSPGNIDTPRTIDGVVCKSVGTAEETFKRTDNDLKGYTPYCYIELDE